jgi:hypothetical protein
MSYVANKYINRHAIEQSPGAEKGAEVDGKPRTFVSEEGQKMLANVKLQMQR